MYTIYLAHFFDPRGLGRNVYVSTPLHNVAELLSFDRGTHKAGTDGTITKITVYEDLSEIPEDLKKGMHDPETFRDAKIKRLQEKLVTYLNPEERELLAEAIKTMKS